jgi:dihydrofolate synthase/folylpolyglutamate synthase
MNYNEVIEHLFKLKRPSSEVAYGCRAITDYMREIGDPHKKYPIIHVAGTNGKGSVSMKIARGLQEAGYRVGLFTSPHIESFVERISIGGVSISEDDVVRGLLKLFERQDQLGFFELTTILGFDYFAKQSVDVAVIEAGIGGLNDSTNVIDPCLSVITSIAEDHLDFLGPTLEDIAFQKAGIIKPSRPVVIGPYANFSIVHEKARECKSDLYLVPQVQGFYDLENSAIAKKALEVLKVPAEAIEEGLKVRPPCRFEVHDRFTLDVAHNPNGISRLLEAIDIHYPGEPVSFVVGMSKDKDVKESLRLITQKASHIYILKSESPKALSCKEMGNFLEALHFDRYTLCSRASEIVEIPGRVVVCGTFYLMREIKSLIHEPLQSLL